jgi:hypothetical protein
MSKPAYDSLDEFMIELEYYGGWPAYRERFLRQTPDNRVIDLSAFDQLLQLESSPSRATAEYIQKRRELGDLHEMLSRARR